MSDVQFNEEGGVSSRFRSRVILGKLETPRMVKFLIKTGFVKNQKTAGNLLLALATIMFLLSIVIFCYFILGIGNDISFSSKSSVLKTKQAPLPPGLRERINNEKK